jgi:GTPase SAR1 family protein
MYPFLSIKFLDLDSADIIFYVSTFEEESIAHAKIHFQKLKPFQEKVILLHNKKDLKDDQSLIPKNLIFENVKKLRTCLNDPNSVQEIIQTFKYFVNLKKNKKISVIFFGTAFSGKSTIYKRFKMNFGKLDGYNLDQTIHDQLIHIFYSIFDNLQHNPKWKPKDLNVVTDFLHDYNQTFSQFRCLNLKNYFDFFKDTYENDEMFREIVSDSHEYSKLGLSDYTPYYLEHMDQIMQGIGEDNPFSDSLILRFKIFFLSTFRMKKNYGLERKTIEYQGFEINFIDTGNLLFLLQTEGDIFHRRKWKNYFHSIDAIIYVGALSHYNEFCFEDVETNKMTESLDILEGLVAEEIISDIPMFLVLNKQDIFFKSLKRYPMSMTFPDCPKELKTGGSCFVSPVFEKKSPEKSIPISLPKKSEIPTMAENLGQDEICQILSFLKYKEIVDCSRVNSTFLEASKNDLLWREICLTYDKTLDFKTVQSFYDTSSIYEPWKNYFIESKTFKNQNYIIQQYLQRSNFRFKSVHVITAVDESNNDFIEEILTEICEIGSQRKK